MQRASSSFSGLRSPPSTTWRPQSLSRIARDAYRDFGKGSGHDASLNFGDCFAYALAKSTGEALLFKGNDFSHTDITPALPAAAG